jgi:hypothetical protein
VTNVGSPQSGQQAQVRAASQQGSRAAGQAAWMGTTHAHPRHTPMRLPSPTRRSQGEPPSSSGRAHTGRKRQGCSSRYIGVSWAMAKSSWYVQVMDPQTKRSRSVGHFSSEEDAARAYDVAAVQAHGPCAKRNFPGEAISELPVSLGEERKQHTSSRYIGVCWHKATSSCEGTCGGRTHRPSAGSPLVPSPPRNSTAPSTTRNWTASTSSGAGCGCRVRLLLSKEQLLSRKYHYSYPGCICICTRCSQGV